MPPDGTELLTGACAGGLVGLAWGLAASVPMGSWQSLEVLLVVAVTVWVGAAAGAGLGALLRLGLRREVSLEAALLRFARALVWLTLAAIALAGVVSLGLGAAQAIAPRVDWRVHALVAAAVGVGATWAAGAAWLTRRIGIKTLAAATGNRSRRPSRGPWRAPSGICSAAVRWTRVPPRSIASSPVGSREGRRSGLGGEIGELDAELRESLRALGYHR
jgi:hypothetical protein